MVKINERKVLKRLQGEFPLSSQPFKLIGDELGIDEDSVLEIVLSLKNRGIIREIGPIFNHKMLGLETYLIGMKVKDIDASFNIINAYEEVTHNYERDGNFNLWFTLVTKKESFPNIIERIKKEINPDCLVILPSLFSFKLLFELDI